MEVETFPDAILNGRPLDLFALYKEVVRRGGYRCLPAGNGTVSALAVGALCICAPALQLGLLYLRPQFADCMGFPAVS